MPDPLIRQQELFIRREVLGQPPELVRIVQQPNGTWKDDSGQHYQLALIHINPPEKPQ